MGRPKGSKNKSKTSEKTSYMPYEGKAFDISEGKLKPVILVEEKKTYSFRNIGEGRIWVDKENGDEILLESGDIIDEVTEKERKYIITKHRAYKEGQLIENLENEPDTLEYIHNALTDKQIRILCSKSIKEFRKALDDIDSKFTLERIRRHVKAEDKSNSFISAVDSRYNEIIDKENEDKIAPTMREEK